MGEKTAPRIQPQRENPPSKLPRLQQEKRRGVEKSEKEKEKEEKNKESRSSRLQPGDLLGQQPRRTRWIFPPLQLCIFSIARTSTQERKKKHSTSEHLCREEAVLSDYVSCLGHS